MTEKEQAEIDHWRKATKESQPSLATMSLLAYVRDGQVVLMRDMTRAFPTVDLPVVKRMICEFLDDLFDKHAKLPK